MIHLVAAVAFVVLAAAIVARRMVRCRARVRRMSAHLEGLMAGATGPFEVEPAGDPLGQLERRMKELSVRAALRAEEMEKEALRQRIDTQVQRGLAMAETENEVLEIASRAIAQAAPSCKAELLLADEHETALHLAAVAGPGAPGCPVATPGGCAAMRCGQTLHFDDVNALDICPHLRNRPGGARPATCIPLAPTRGAAGVLHVTSDNGPIPPEAIVRLESVTTHVGGRLRMLHVLSVFQAQAETDALTGLLNRRSFEHRATSLVRSRRSFLLAIVDIDHFKRLNDEHGHAVGDQCLRVFARVAGNLTAERGGIAARLGGEEFVLLLPLAESASADTPFDELRAQLAAATGTGACPRFTVSVGVALFPAHGTALGELLGAADSALYQAKKQGRDQIVVHGAAPPSGSSPRLRNIA